MTGHGADWVELTLLSADGDQGFPGALTVRTRYQLIPGGAQVTYRATTTAATVVNLTTHPYFNLNGEGSGATDRHRLVIHASRYTPPVRTASPPGKSATSPARLSTFGPARYWARRGTAP